MDNYKIIEVNKSNIDLLSSFLTQLGPAVNTFRYYNKRHVSIINNHLITLLLLKNDTPVAYGHLDKENEKVWLGICVLPLNWGQGLSKIIIEKLIEKAQEFNVSVIYLTVDRSNLTAINLYEKYNFEQIQKENDYYSYILKLKTP